MRLEPGRAEDHGNDRVARGLEGSGDDLGWAAIAAHRVDRDADHRLGGVETERLDVATSGLVVTEDGGVPSGSSVDFAVIWEPAGTRT